MKNVFKKQVLRYKKASNQGLNFAKSWKHGIKSLKNLRLNLELFTARNEEQKKHW